MRFTHFLKAVVHIDYFHNLLSLYLRYFQLIISIAGLFYVALNIYYIEFVSRFDTGWAAKHKIITIRIVTRQLLVGYL